MNHTPTPWRTSKDLDTGRRVFIEYEHNGKPFTIADVTYSFSEQQNESDAAFIVRAVNNHDALVGALRALYDLTPDCEGGELGEACRMARAVLAAAEAA